MAVKVVARFAMRIVVVLLWVLLFPALLVNPAVAMVLGSLAHDTSVGRPDEQLSLATYLIMWAVSGGVLVLFAATAFRRERQWSQWTDTATVRVVTALYALGLGCLAAAIGPGLADVPGPLQTMAVYSGIVAWALLGAAALTFALVGQRGQAWLATGALVVWGVLAFAAHGTVLATVQIAGVLLGVAALATYLLWLRRGFGFSIRAAIRHRVRTGRTIRVHPDIDRIDMSLADVAGEDESRTRGY